MLWGAGLTAGAVGVLVAIVLLSTAGPTGGVRESPEVSMTRAQDIVRNVPRVRRSGPVGAEYNRAARATERGLESRVGRLETIDDHMGDYVDPDGAVPPFAAVEGFAVAEEAYQDPEHDLPMPDPREAGSDVGQHVDPGDSP